MWLASSGVERGRSAGLSGSSTSSPRPKKVSPKPPRSGGMGVDDQVAIADRGVRDGQLEHPEEEHPAAARAASVGAEDELVQVALQVCLVDRSLMGAQQPSFGQRRDAVDAG